MPNHVYVKDNVVFQAITGDPYGVFGPAYAEKFVIAPDEVQEGWTFDGKKYRAPVVVPPPEVVVKTPEEINKENNFNTAKNLLTGTDWVLLSDVSGNTANPKLINVDDFIQYRSALRQIALNPPETPVTEWPTVPAEQWSTANT